MVLHRKGSRIPQPPQGRDGRKGARGAGRRDSFRILQLGQRRGGQPQARAEADVLRHGQGIRHPACDRVLEEVRAGAVEDRPGEVEGRVREAPQGEDIAVSFRPRHPGGVHALDGRRDLQDLRHPEPPSRPAGRTQGDLAGGHLEAHIRRGRPPGGHDAHLHRGVGPRCGHHILRVPDQGRGLRRPVGADVPQAGVQDAGPPRGRSGSRARGSTPATRHWTGHTTCPRGWTPP